MTKPFTEELKAARLREFLSRVARTVARAETESRDESSSAGEASDSGSSASRDSSRSAEDAVSAEALQLLSFAAARPQSFLMEHYESLGASLRVAKRSLTEAEALGWVQMHKLVRTGRGARPCVLEVREAGAAELRRRGLPAPANHNGRGSFSHWVYCRILARSSLFAGFDISFESKFGKKISDVLGRGPDGLVTSGEVITSGSVAHNANAMRRALAVVGLHELIVACDDQAFMRRLETRLKEEATPGLFQPKLRFVFLGECVAEYVGKGVVK